MNTTATTTRKTVRWIATVAILVLIGWLVLPKLDLFGDEDTASDGKAGSPGAGAAGGPPPAKVGIYVAEKGQLDAPLSLPGTILPNERVDITSEVSGKVVEIYFNEGTGVSAGTVLARLNDADLQANLKRAESRKKLAQQNLDRKKALLDRNGISTAEYEAVVNELEVATAEIELINAQIEKTVIRAPFGGVIGLRKISLGSYVTPSTVIATLQDVDPLKVEFTVPERYAASIRPGMVLNYTADAGATTRTARVYATEPSLDARTRSLMVRALSSNAGGDVLPGQFAEVELKTGASVEMTLVPTEAVVPTMQGQQVFIVRGGKAIASPVQLGSRSEALVGVVEGIGHGDTVVVSGLQGVRDGGPVQIMGG